MRQLGARGQVKERYKQLPEKHQKHVFNVQINFANTVKFHQFHFTNTFKNFLHEFEYLFDLVVQLISFDKLK